MLTTCDYNALFAQNVLILTSNLSSFIDGFFKLKCVFIDRTHDFHKGFVW